MFSDGGREGEDWSTWAVDIHYVPWPTLIVTLNQEGRQRGGTQRRASARKEARRGTRKGTRKPGLGEREVLRLWDLDRPLPKDLAEAAIDGGRAPIEPRRETDRTTTEEPVLRDRSWRTTSTKKRREIG